MDNRHWRIVFALASLILAPCARADDAPPPIREFDIPTIERLGREMYDQDQLAWKATDILFTKHKKEELVALKQHGWIVDSFPDHDVVRFVRETDLGPVFAYDVTFVSGEATGYSEPQNTLLSGEDLTQYNARTTALKNVNRMCAETMNTVALKDPQGDGWLVWAMAATTKPDTMIVGGHFRFTISKDGKSIVRKDALSHSCLNIAKPRPKNDETTLGAFVGHMVSLTPIETYVFDSLSYRETFNIETLDGKAWKIADGRISEIDMDMAGNDGKTAQLLAGLAEKCELMVADATHPPDKPQTVDIDSVIFSTQGTKEFEPTVPKDSKIQAAMCGRNDFFLAPNDYKVLAAGIVLYIVDKGEGHAKRMGALEISDGRVRFRVVDGAPMTEQQKKQVGVRLDAFQENFYTKN